VSGPKITFRWEPVASTPCRDCGLPLPKGLFFYEPGQEAIGPFCGDCGAAHHNKLMDSKGITSEQFSASMSKEELAKVYVGLVATGAVKDERVAAALKDPDLYEKLVEGMTKDEVAALGLVKPEDLV
jgi:hypothetical protein